MPKKIITDAQQTVRLFQTKKSEYWVKRGQTSAIALFKKAARLVPAYRQFLKKHRVNPAKVRTWNDFQHVPTVDRKNYLTQFPLEDLVWPTAFQEAAVFSATSGSSGTPFYFPRSSGVDAHAAAYHRWFLTHRTRGKNDRTLIIDCFGMGVWIGGLITYQAFRSVADEGYPLTIITPGVNKQQIFEALVNVAPKFSTVVLCGYPPFIKDIIDQAGERGVRWSKLNIKVLFAAESFSEKFRQYLVEKTNIHNYYTDTTNIYGSADLGTMALETPLTILMREKALADKNIYQRFFQNVDRLPTLAQFNPEAIQFEAPSGTILCTGNSGLPLIRYAIGDNGAVTSFSEAVHVFEHDGVNLRQAARQVGISKTVAELPFIYVYERSDLSTKLYGVIIYPEHLKDALREAPFDRSLTGNFTLQTKHDRHENEYLEVNIELRNKVKQNRILKAALVEKIITALTDKNAEYRNNMQVMPERMRPRLVFWQYEHPLHFSRNAKQKWAKR
ncbi:hypothetical protein COV04_03975 [Candidatus Uhrbacteria bacterium CG10_big_fil_rev_8_21_14_0_10_48_11]|uniref:Phenylacetate--CoA ligase n=1 Tax=Candidatus Uhrbacteria bacterium CG10_big_fil_rev_8_21_14_0_10_48_11 TaxID=1975037 RepID=A0A2M8LDM6_9BACT|nr:MAG: hypothetical protein COV04_03975 [Candidatus Uhrbacteria bacterium CG10_big_fil_rev_8_21_14_0_10_48_11]